VPAYWPGDVRHVDDASLICRFAWNGRGAPDTAIPYGLREGVSQRLKPQGIEYRRVARWADRLVVAMKPL